jgi:hypothetical protein
MKLKRTAKRAEDEAFADEVHQIVLRGQAEHAARYVNRVFREHNSEQRARETDERRGTGG